MYQFFFDRYFNVQIILFENINIKKSFSQINNKISIYLFLYIFLISNMKYKMLISLNMFERLLNIQT